MRYKKHNPTQAAISAAIAQNTKLMRERMGWSLQQLASEAGLAKSYVWDIETGSNTNPSILTLVALSEALGVTITYLVGLEPQP